MKPNIKITIAFVAAMAIAVYSCKKSVVDNQELLTNGIDANVELSRTLAIGLAKSSAELSSSSGLKTGNTPALKTNDNEHACGQVVLKSSNSTKVIGDTTRTVYKQNRFTYMCNGYYHNNYNIDAYTEQDTLTTTDVGRNFKNVFTVTVDYDVRSKAFNYTELLVNGFTSTSAYTSKLAGNKVIESHSIYTGYTWSDIHAVPTPLNPATYLFGKVDFAMRITDVDDTTSATGKITDFSGYLLFINEPDVIHVYIKQTNSYYRAYAVNTKTGKVTLIR